MNQTVYRTSEAARGEAPEPHGPPDRPAAAPPLMRRVESATLFERGREVVIVHHGQEYRLRITKSDKLILTK
jgi:hemin uptake protein HemP